MKKALLVTRVSGFIPQFEMDRVRMLQQMGYEVHYAANYDTVVYGNDNSRLDNTGIVKHHIGFPRNPFSRKTIRTYQELKNLIATGDFDIIHCHMPISGILTRLAANSVANDSKVIYTAHGFHFFSGAPLKNWIYYLPEWFCARYTDFLITMNGEDFRRTAHFPVRGRRVKIPGIGMNLGDMKSIEETFAMKNGREESDSTVIISVGEVNAGKNHIRIIDMMRNFKGENVQYYICGEGDMKPGLEAKVAEWGLEDSVHLLGYRNDVEELLERADIFVLPSLREGLPVAVMEAMKAGLPVVAKNIRGNKDLIDSGKGGILVNSDETPRYERAIRKLMEIGPEKRMKIGKYNQEKIKKFSCEEVNKIMKKVYEYCDR